MEDLHRKLRFLEADYPDQPAMAKPGDLCEINRLRAQLGMPRVDDALREIGEACVDDVSDDEATKENVPDHSQARAIYQEYLQKAEALKPHREYAAKVSNATAGRGQTPVRPLATMGPRGGPLLCDVCGKPIVLEGGEFHGVNADDAWKRSNQKDWKSWILGGMVVEIETNGTLRIYHGYPGQSSSHCCNIATRQDEAARAAFDSSQRDGKWPMILAFIEHEFPDMDVKKQNELLNDILDTVYEYDPGVGVNRPDSTC